MIVVDANVMVMALAGPSDRGEAARAALFADDEWAAPAHMPLEVVRTLHKAVSTNQLAGTDADAAFRALTAMQIMYVETDSLLLHTVWKLRHNVSIYDAAYLAVAAVHDAPLVTFDARLAKGALQAIPEVAVTVL
ncbi:type II toxin-antitoxin system VapC family toxin [Nocardia testacea]|uniref:type II toxin-antitoxin system VapC family toxin n=1 Tax=Nocardia testacea TaxID=248551 RepID=UPI0002FB85DD|nr:type II toxin-antitoxin system VapC family toxin [Nocardia testacea]